ncbi:hypothetical protein E2R59_15915 [Kocuria rosea]|uniref:VOC domain-containing protein n=2 Tax=Kocuria rosea TaxID=1275 RepID=A0A4R5Y7F9_KOCRO|nr:hypothetical protein E2R59_15915 [Kocuria rosea]
MSFRCRSDAVLTCGRGSRHTVAAPPVRGHAEGGSRRTTKGSTMAPTDFITLPVSDLERSKRFYSCLGWRLHPAFEGTGAGTVEIREDEHVMVLSEDRHLRLVGPEGPGTPADASVVNALSVDSPDEIDVIVDRAVRAGGTEGDAQDYGFLRSRCFRDPDGHQWEILWVDPAAASLRAARRR